MGVSNPVHQPKCALGEYTLAKVIFDHNGRSHANSFSQEDERILRMVQNIDEHYNVKTAVWVWNVFPVEHANWNMDSGLQKRIYTLNFDVWLPFLNQPVDGSVAATDVKNTRAGGNQARKMIG
jgi:hypothetical protein